jgi:23S rRNA (cytosine1962-C5)-methyltransferase
LVLTTRRPDPELADWAETARGLIGSTGVVQKVKARTAGQGSSQVQLGQTRPGLVQVREEDAVFLCDLDGSLGTGLFLDQAETRRLIRGYSSGAEVLNLFAYTGAFSVHAALAGAKRVTSVDVSKRALARGRENMVASGLDPDRHRWFTDDVPEHLARAVRRGLAYDLVILDPPTFGRGKGSKVLALERDLDSLVSRAVRLVAPGGLLVAAFHGAAFTADRALEAIAEGAEGRTLHRRHQLGLPEWDHPAVSEPDEDDRGDYLRTLVLTIG